MSAPKQIVELLGQKPNLNSNEIAQTLNARIDSIKVTLNKMVKAGKLVRDKVAREAKTNSGPQKVYAYRLSEVKSETTEPA